MNNDISVFRHIFGNSPVVKLIDFFLGSPAFDFSLTEISREAGISWSTLQAVWPGFLTLGIVKETRKIGRAKMYALNTSCPVVKILMNMEREIVSIFHKNMDNIETKNTNQQPTDKPVLM